MALAAGQAARALDGIHGWIIEPDQQEEIRPVKNGPFLSFPYVCPEPVLVKRSFLYINGDINGEEERMAQKVVIAPLSHHANHASRRARDKHEEILTHWMVVLFLNFSYVCPEPVLVNVRFFSITMAQKGGLRGRDRL